MTNKNGTTTTTTTTMWQDAHSGLRRHKLMTKELGDTIPRSLRQRRTSEDYDAVVAKVKLFSPPITAGAGTSPSGRRETGLCFGLVEGFETELGVLRPHGARGGNGVRQRPRCGARPVLGAADPRRGQEAVLGDSGLAPKHMNAV